MRRIVPVLFIVLLVLLPLPPLFTDGDCNAEFERTSSALEHLRSEVLTLSAAISYLAQHHMTYSTISPQRCEDAPPPEVEVCPGGPILRLAVPVQNLVCHYYRDPTIRLQLGYNRHEQLVRMQTDMNPFHFKKLPLLGIEVDWAK